MVLMAPLQPLTVKQERHHVEAPATGPFLRKSQNTVSIHPNGIEIITVSILFRRLKILFFEPSRDCRLEGHSQSQYSVGNRSSRGKEGARRFFYAVVFVYRRKCVVGKLPCNALAFVCALAQTDC